MTLFIQACAPDKSTDSTNGFNFHMTPVDIADYSSELQSSQNFDTATAATAGTNQMATNGVERLPLYRFLYPATGRRLSTLSSVLTDKDWKLEGELFQVYTSLTDSRIPIFSCMLSNAVTADHFTSNDPACEGASNQGLLGYLESAPTAEASTTVYRCFRRLVGRMDTTNVAECQKQGFEVEKILGYAP